MRSLKTYLPMRILAFLALVVVSATPTSLFAQPEPGSSADPDRERVIAGIVAAMIEREHFNPREMDGSVAEEAFELYLERLDPSKQFLRSEDVSELSAWKSSMVGALNRGDYQLMNKAVSLLETRVEDVQGFYGQILEEPFDFTIDESIVTDPEAMEYATTQEEQRERWRKYLKYQTLVRYLSLLENSDSSQDEFHPELEAKAREQVAENTERWLDRIETITRGDHVARYINSVINVFDPHTEYYPPLEKENFDINITGQLEGIGAQLREEDGYIKVVKIVPGSASWRGEELEAEDLILKVAQDDDEPVDVVGASIDDAVQMIRGPKGTTVVLTVKKPDGRIKDIEIVRDVVVLEETYAKGAIIDDSVSGGVYGYIDLPKFYTDFKHTGSPKVSEDVRDLLEEFKKQNVEGVILDLRYNGGGSLQEAVEMAGLFIETGPIVQTQDRFGNKTVYPDNDKEIAWKGDLLVMVNSFSASASEILAGMLQDYDRAVIVGAKSTFGKGTVQRFYDLDDAVNRKYSEYSPLGSVKITMQQFYRVNGASTQFEGVTPDVVLPDVFSNRTIGERSLEHSLPPDTISSSEHVQWLQRDIPSQMLSEKSGGRVAGSEHFQLIANRAERMKEEQDRTERSLNWRTALEHQLELDAEAKKLEESKPDLSNLEVKPLQKDIDDETKAAIIQDFVDNLKVDAYLGEAVSILSDLRSISREQGWTYGGSDESTSSTD